MNKDALGLVDVQDWGGSRSWLSFSDTLGWWYELVAWFLTYSFSPAQNDWTNVCVWFGSVQQDSQGQNGPIPSMNTSACRQLVLFSTITLLIVIKGQKVNMKPQNPQRRRKDQTLSVLPLQWRVQCPCLHFLSVYIRGETWLHLKTRTLTHKAGLSCYFDDLAG